MILTLDLGNTNLKLALFPRNVKQSNVEPYFFFSCKTEELSDHIKPAENLCRDLRKRFGVIPLTGEAIGCSVVPEFNSFVEILIRNVFGISIVWSDYSRCLHTGLLEQCLFPEKIGMDLLAQAVAGLNIYGVPCLILSFGTCTAITAISSQGNLFGKVIAPGLGMGLQALSLSAALLPETAPTFEACDQFWWSMETKESMQLGVCQSVMLLIRHCVDKMRRDYAPKFVFVVATGYFSRMFPKNMLDGLSGIDYTLTLKGLRLLSDNYCSLKDKS